jgi:hypothetical protein
MKAISQRCEQAEHTVIAVFEVKKEIPVQTGGDWVALE